MTLTRAPHSEVLTYRELIKLRSLFSMLSRFVLQDTKLTSLPNLRFQYSKNFDSSYGHSFQGADVANIAKDLALRWSVQRAGESSYRHYLCVRKLMRRFREALRLVGNPDDKAASENFSAIRDALSVTHLDNAVLSSSKEHGVLLYMESATAHTRVRKQNRTLNGRASYPYATLLHQELRSIHVTTCKIYAVRLKDFLPIKIPQTKTVLLPVKRLYMNTTSFFFYDSAENKETFAACTKALAQRVFSTAKKHYSLRKEMAPSAPAPERRPELFTLNEHHWLKSVPAPRPVVSILSWLAERLRTTKNALAFVMNALRSLPCFRV